MAYAPIHLVHGEICVGFAQIHSRAVQRRAFEAFHEEQHGGPEDTTNETEVKAGFWVSRGIANVGRDRKPNEVGHSLGALDVAPASAVLLYPQLLIAVDPQGDLGAADKKAVHPDKQ